MYSSGISYKPASAFNTHTWSVIKHRAIPVELALFCHIVLGGGKHVFLGGNIPCLPPSDKTLQCHYVHIHQHMQI